MPEQGLLHFAKVNEKIGEILNGNSVKAIEKQEIFVFSS
jgi:hypothetical protein